MGSNHRPSDDSDEKSNLSPKLKIRARRDSNPGFSLRRATCYRYTTGPIKIIIIIESRDGFEPPTPASKAGVLTNYTNRTSQNRKRNAFLAGNRTRVSTVTALYTNRLYYEEMITSTHSKRTSV